ncbi:hypothetical protein MMC07_009928 [Pseudocyphellaria aurata]|nr:hypothetical protein [Pseudocyphellaria aurata]
MAGITFSLLPAEIHVSIARNLNKADLKNLCLTSGWMNERLSCVLYRHVDLQLRPYWSHLDYTSGVVRLNARGRQQQFVRTLLSHPEYGKHVRFFKGTLGLPDDHDSDPEMRKDVISEEELWGAMQLLTHVQSVEIGCRDGDAEFEHITSATKQVPEQLFQSATSVKLIGHLQYGLAKAILTAINPSTLEDLCLEMVHDSNHGPRPSGSAPEQTGEDRGMGAHRTTPGLLMMLTGKCTALRTFTLRRLGQARQELRWDQEKEEAAYSELASFIRSVKGTVEKFTFEQVEEKSFEDYSLFAKRPPYRLIDEMFNRHILPVIVSGSWPCLGVLELHGIRSLYGPVGKGPLMTELRAALGGNTEVAMED